MAASQIVIVILVTIVSTWPRPSLGHARLWVPVGRSSMWRQGYPTPINYQDNELYCGGFSHQVSLGYKCGVCGDPYDGKRENEAGGKYATGTVTRTYRQGEEVTFEVDVTANHKGYLEFKICPTNDPKVKETQDCFDRHPLSLRDGSGSKYFIPINSGVMAVNLTLPFDLVCEFCVVQMRYHAGNNWGSDPDGKSCVGCGPQEEFYGCADIRILSTGTEQRRTSSKPNGGVTAANRPENSGTANLNQSRNDGHTGRNISNNSTPVVTSNTSSHGSHGDEESSGALDQRGSNATKGRIIYSGNSNGSDNPNSTGVNGDSFVCRGVNGQSSLDNWCQLNCQSGHCPPTHCWCVKGQYKHSSPRPEGCRAAGAYANVPGLDLWCRQNCGEGSCPSSHCVC